MESIDTQTWIILAAVVALALISVGAWFFYRKKSDELLEVREPRQEIIVEKPSRRVDEKAA